MTKDAKGHGSDSKGMGHAEHWAASQASMKEAAEHAKAGRPKEAADARVKAREHADEANYLKGRRAPVAKSGGSGSHSYNAASVDKGIDSAYRGQKAPTASQRAVTHSLLKGREGGLAKELSGIKATNGKKPR